MMPVRRNQQWLPSIFNDFFDNNYIAKANNTAPAVNVIENDTDYRVELAVPGMTKDDFKVKLDEDNNLVITMEKCCDAKPECKSDKIEKKDCKYLRREFSYAKFQQTMILPDNVDAAKISAKVENGVLMVDIPKLPVEHTKLLEKEIVVQ